MKSKKKSISTLLNHFFNINFFHSGTAMLSKKEGLKERDRLINELEELQKKVQIQSKYIEQIEEKNSENDEKIKDLYRQLEDISNDAFKGKRAFEQVSSKLQETSDEKQFLADESKKFKQQVRENKVEN